MVKARMLEPQSWRTVPVLWDGGLPISGGMNERYDVSIQPAPEPASKEEEVTKRAPTDGATIIRNLGMA